jgi:hypothetical protein
MGVRRTLLLVARHADIWHTIASVVGYRQKNVLLKEFVAAASREESAIERSVHWTGRQAVGALLSEGVSMFTTEIHPTDDGYDFTEFKDMIAWRDQQR